MLSYCLKYRKDTEKINQKVSKTSNDKVMILQNVPYSVIKDQDLSKKQEASGTFSTLGLKTPLSKIPLLGGFCFKILKWTK